MVEVPAAALGAASLAKEADFLSLGTNDLAQYVLAADRSNPAVGWHASTLHPAVLQLVRHTAQACEEAGVSLSICGDMAADPLALPLVIGMGIHELSVPVGMLPLVREIVCRIDSDKARKLVGSAIEFSTAAEVETSIRHTFGEQLGDIWQEYGLSD